MKEKPIILCPYCEWHIPFESKKPLTKFKEHLKECEEFSVRKPEQ